MTIVSQFSPILKKTSHLLRLVRTSPLTLSSPFSLLFHLQIYPLIQFRLTRRPPQLYNLPAIPQLRSRTLLLLYQLDYSFQFLPENDQSENTQELPPFTSLLSDVRPLLSRPNPFKFRLHHSILGRQHRREYYTNRARRTKRPRFNQHLQYSLKPEFSTREIVVWDSRLQEYTIQSTSLHSQRLVVLPQAITAHSRSTLLHQTSSLTINFPPTHLFRCPINSTTMGLPPASIVCGRPPLTTPSHAPPLRQPITDDTFILQPKNPSKQDAEALQPPPGSSSLLPSLLQHQAQSLQAINTTLPTVLPTLQVRTTRPQDITNYCPSNSE